MRWVAAVIAATGASAVAAACERSDARLRRLRDVVCGSGVGAAGCVGAADWPKHDWPSQAVYVADLVEALARPDTCLNTTTAADVVSWLNTYHSTIDADSLMYMKRGANQSGATAAATLDIPWRRVTATPRPCDVDIPWRRASHRRYTWTVFQVQYYDMPRRPDVRIESADTLGRKCWAFACSRRADLSPTGRGDAAAATSRVPGDESRATP